MENDLVGFAADLLDAPGPAVGTVTSGGTESVLLAVQGARDARPDVERPRMVLPSTAHAAFHKAAHYFGVEAVVVPVGADFRADVGRDGRGHRRARRTVLVVGSARRRTRTASSTRSPSSRPLAAARGIRCHVDACIGGWVLPYAARLGRAVPPWTFAVDGVTSISVDLHKYAYAPKGTSLLLHRTPDAAAAAVLRVSADWPGYTMLNPTMQSTKSGGPLAGAWAVVQLDRRRGLPRADREGVRGRRPDRGGHRRDPGLRLVVPPDSTLVALAHRRRPATCSRSATR